MHKVIYFNQWFSSIALVIEDLKKRNGNSIKIIASSKNKDHVYKNYVDDFIVEDWEETGNHEESMNNYIGFIYNTCNNYNVDYFFVKKHAETILKHKKELNSLGTHIIGEWKERLESKGSVYDFLAWNKNLREYIPEWWRFDNALIGQAFKLINEHSGKNDICFKLDSGEGGQSFREIDDSPLKLDSLNSYRMNKLTSDEAVKLIANSSGIIDRLIFMEKLDGPEISVDCYNSKQGFIAICRSKHSGRVEKIYYDEKIMNICNTIQEEIKLEFPFNVQFRYKHREDGTHTMNDLRLLEINNRISGGLYYEVSEGLNIADVCLKDCMNKSNEYNINDFINFETRHVTHLEIPIHLS